MTLNLDLARVILPNFRDGGEDLLVACTVATEVPPQAMDSPISGHSGFKAFMIEPAIKAVIDVVRNRVKNPKAWLRPNSRIKPPVRPIQVVQYPKAFSAVAREEYWVDALVGNWFEGHIIKCLAWWREEWFDTTNGSTHYYSPVRMNPPGRVPSWAQHMTQVYIDGLDPWWFTFLRM